jgi:hypothetical protein
MTFFEHFNRNGNHRTPPSVDGSIQTNVQLQQRIDALHETAFDDAQIPDEVALKLDAWQAPEVAPSLTTALIDQLALELPQPEAKSRSIAQSRVMRLQWGILLIRSQLRVVQRELWLASAVVMLIGTLVTLTTYAASPSFPILPVVLIAPLVAAVGVAFVYGPLNDPALEVELAAPVSPRMIGLTRITMVFGFNFVLALAGSAFLALSGVGLTLMPLISAWLAPMAMLSALAFLLSVLFFDPLVSTMFSVIVWVALSLHRYVPFEVHPLLAALLNLLTETRPVIWLLTLVMVAAGVWLTGDGERWVGVSER